MKYFVRINKNGEIIVVFKEQEKTKLDTIEITEEQYNQWLQYRKEGKRVILNNGQIEILAPTTPTLSELKALKMIEIKEKFQNAVKFGVIEFTIPSSNTQVQVDARRNSSNNDLQNVEGLIELIQLGQVQTPILYKCYDNNKYEMTLQDLVALKFALMGYGLQLYAKKHYLEDLVGQAQTKEELEQIKW